MRVFAKIHQANTYDLYSFHHEYYTSIKRQKTRAAPIWEKILSIPY